VNIRSHRSFLHRPPGGGRPPEISRAVSLIGLRWVLILLNEFRPEYWRRRQLAGFSGDRRDASTRQLDRARELLARLDTSSDLQQYSQRD
jgi:hypothetical protein